MATTYTQTVAQTNATYAGFLAWAGKPAASPTGIANGLSTLGFTKQADTYTAQWDNGTTVNGAGHQALPTNAGNLFGAAFPTTASNAREPLAGTHFRGAWVSGTSYVAGDVVTDATDAQIVFICTTANSGTTVPNQNAAQWSPYWMEIYASSGATTYYLKVEYGGGATATNPQISWQWGTAYVANSGVVSGNITLVEQGAVGTGTNASVAYWMSSDGNNRFAMMGWPTGANPFFMCFERSINGSSGSGPNYTNDRIDFIVGFSTATWTQSSLFFSTSFTATGVANGLGRMARNAFAATVNMGGLTASLAVNSNIPVFPVFPLVGFTGMPLTCVVAGSVADFTETQHVTDAVSYGHTVNFYLMSITAFVKSFGGAGQTTSYAVGIRYE